MDKLVYIIPVHERDEELLTRSVNSVLQQTIKSNCLIVKSDSVDLTNIEILDKNAIPIISTSGKSYQELVNFAIDNVSTIFKYVDWISILEFDDELQLRATKIFKEYSDDIIADIYAPIALVVKKLDSDSEFIQLLNETAWAVGLSEEQGYTDFNMMLRNSFLFVNGLYIKLDFIKQIGGFKQQMKYNFDYEWGIRAVYNGGIIFNIPRISRIHYIRDNSMMSDFLKLTDDEKMFWLAAARKEYFYEPWDPRYNSEVLKYGATK